MTGIRIGIIGGGIVGLSTAYKLALRFPKSRITVLEKEPRLAEHQTGRNSGVIHSGIYYKPGSLKAITCRDGKRQLERFCAEHGVPFETCGKVVVATHEAELPALEMITARAEANGVESIPIDRARLKELEPACEGIAGLHVPETGIVDYRAFCERIAEILRDRGNEIQLGTEVQRLEEREETVIASTRGQEMQFNILVNCGGLFSDRIVRMAGAQPTAKIVPFRGEYYELRPSAHHLCRNLIYPVPDPRFPFLGVHLTRMIHGGVECGPNAVLALAREGYDWGKISVRDLSETLTYPGFIRLAAKYWRNGMGEVMRSLSKKMFVKALQRLVPALQEEDLVKAEAGVRAQAIAPSGALVDDFLISSSRRLIHVVNAPSPAATACLAIADRIVVGVCERLDTTVQPV